MPVCCVCALCLCAVSVSRVRVLNQNTAACRPREPTRLRCWPRSSSGSSSSTRRAPTSTAWQPRHHFGPFWTILDIILDPFCRVAFLSSIPPHTPHVRYALLSAHAYRMLIGASNPTLLPIPLSRHLRPGRAQPGDPGAALARGPAALVRRRRRGMVPATLWQLRHYFRPLDSAHTSAPCRAHIA